MPAKYHIHVRQVPPRFSPPGKSTVMDWNEGCLRCAKCVKEVCPVDAYRKRGFDRTQFADTIDSMCRDCYRCVQGCPRELIFKAMNPQYRQLGDALLDAGDHRHDLEPGGNRQDPGLRGRLWRGFCRRGLRLLLDRHVGDRPAHPGRHPRPGIHQHHRRPGAQTHVSGLR